MSSLRQNVDNSGLERYKEEGRYADAEPLNKRVLGID